MEWIPLIQNIGSLLLFCLSLWLARRVYHLSASEPNRQPALGLSALVIGYGFLGVFVGFSEKVVLTPSFLLIWNAWVWAAVLFSIILVTVSLLDISERTRPSPKGRKVAWFTLVLSVIFFVGLGLAALSKFGEFRDGEIHFKFDLPDYQDLETHPDDLLWDLKRNSDFFSEKFRYGVSYEGTPWQPSPLLLEQYPDAEFALERKDGSVFIMTPVYFTKKEPRTDVFMTALLKGIKIDINSPAAGRWERQQQNGYEGFVFDFEEMAQRGEMLYRLRLLSDQSFGYLVLTGTDMENPHADSILDELQDQVAFEQPPKQLPKLEEFSPEENGRHERFYQAAAKEHERLEEFKEAQEYYEEALQFEPEDTEVIQDLVFSYLQDENPQGAKEVLERYEEKWPDLSELTEVVENGWKPDESPKDEKKFRSKFKKALEKKPSGNKTSVEKKEQDQGKEKSSKKSGKLGIPSKRSRKKIPDQEGRERKGDSIPGPHPETAKADGVPRSAGPRQEIDEEELPIEEIRLPQGFSMDIFASELPSPNQLVAGTRGTIFVGSRNGDFIYALVDEDRDGKADQKYTLAVSLGAPLGIGFYEGALYVAAGVRIFRLEGIEARLDRVPEQEVVYQALPKDFVTGQRALGVGPGGQLYVSVESRCNICELKDERFATIIRMLPDGSEDEIFSRGVRSVGGLAWHPESGALWLTDQGRELLSEEYPLDELNRAPFEGLHFGYPRCYGKNVLDPYFGRRGKCGGYTIPAIELGAHVGASGLCFYTGVMFPPEYRNQIFIAERGSDQYPASEGYRVSVVQIEGDQALSYHSFAEGWMANGRYWGRPSDVIVAPDGSLLVSDEHAGVIYRIVYEL